MSMTSFLIYCVIVTFTPGPTNIALLSIAQNARRKEAFRYIWGVTAAFGVLLAASVMLNNALAAVMPKILAFMQIIGCMYILYLAYQVYKMDISGDSTKQAATFMTGFLMQFVNPKVWLFTMTVIPSYVMPYYKSQLVLSIFVLVITIVAFLALVTWVIFGMVFKRFLQKHLKMTNIILALLLVYSAIEVSGIIEIVKR
ncbi:LysE family translocator [Paenibacillus ehimensis]|uniref:LysE family translocator n=1 Tax=Paenibacillus ehimensis TaxID=79264 RepID=A0ABT8VH66_9BACL|nr:LysE family translocator [Paenibacillus ehimensis]MDO3680322.1 LysE family translocator [Paenibacillus ehimensis]MEC0211385.1 LysE family translocator [Paenibacillus ehimensis]